MVDLTTPQAQVAQQFMRDKGYDLPPYEIVQLDGQPCWYFYYELAEGDLELEVFWDSSIGEWETTVTVFTLAV